MNSMVQKIPFLRIAIALAAGILLSGHLFVQTTLLLFLLFLLLGLLAFLNKKYDFRFEVQLGWLITFIIILLGILVAQIKNRKPEFQSGSFSALVLESLVEKENSFQTILKLESHFKNDSVVTVSEKVMAYFEKNEPVQQLQAGDVILLNAHPQFVKNNGNPFEFDYKSYLANKQIYRQVYLPTETWKQTEIKKSSFRILAETTREKLLAIYRNQSLGENETEILSALTLGYKRGLDPEIKRVFSAAGAMHVLAVSGLHVGVIYAVFIGIFGFLRKSGRGKIIFVIAALLLLWTYAFITGLSPSVMRASTMFSLVCIGSNIQRRPNIYNSLAFAAFFLLLVNPNNLYEVGFQLSFAAVAGIVFLQPKLANIWPVKNKLLKYIRDLLAVSIAAQVATFPFTAYYFSQFPTYFWLSNFIVIPAAFLLIGLGMGMLIFSSVPILSTVLAFTTKFVIHIVYYFLQLIEKLPGSVIERGLGSYEAFLVGLILVSFFIFLAHKTIRSLKSTFLLLLLFTILLFGEKISTLHKSGFIAYNYPENITVQFIVGSENYILSEFPISEKDYVFRDISAVVTKKHLSDPIFLTFKENFESQHLLSYNNMVAFMGKTFCLESEQNPPAQNIQPEYIFTRKNPPLAPDYQGVPALTILFKNYNTPGQKDNTFNVRHQGAYQYYW